MVAAAERLAGGLGVSRITGAILARRGFAEIEEARSFLAAGVRHPAGTLPGVPDACELILSHLERGSRIMNRLDPLHGAFLVQRYVPTA